MGYKNYQTPPHEFLPWHQRYRFTIDVAGGPNDPIRPFLPRYIGPDTDGLKQSWRGERVWCNPPYVDIESWLDKRHEPDFIFYLLPPSVDTGWFHRLIYRNPRCTWTFLDHRIAFLIDGVVDPSPRAGNLIAMFGDADAS